MFNPGPFWSDAVSSILSQSFQNIELIIVDDGSDLEVTFPYDHRIRYVNLSHQGLPAALNTGIALARGKYVARMDADDISYPDRIRQQVAYMETHDADVVATRVDTNSTAGEGIRHFVQWSNALLSHKEMKRNRYADVPIVHPTAMFRASSFERYGIYTDEPGPEDFELWLRWFHQGATFAKLEDRLLLWRDHASRLTRIDSNYDLAAFTRTKARYFLMEYREKNVAGVWVAGYGTSVFQKSHELEAAGVSVTGFVDVKPRKGSRNVVTYDQLDPVTHSFVVSLIGDRNGKSQIRAFLTEKGYVEGESYYIM